MNKGHYAELDSIFHPHSVAIIGASPTGDMYSKTLIGTRIKDQLYFVNPKYNEIFGKKCYSSILDITEPIDHVIVVVSAALVLKAISECIQKGVKCAHIFTAGFSETGIPEAIDLEKQLKEISEGKIRIIGPNCFGIYCPSSGLAIVPESPQEVGGVGVIAQSGTVAELFSYYGKTKNILMSKVVSYGNAVDLDSIDFLEYMADDPETKVIALYIEGSKDGKRLKEALTYATARKPVVAVKGGLSENGNRVARSHTAQMTGTPETWKSLFTQCGVNQVNTFDELMNLVAAFSNSPLPRGNRVAMLTNSGGLSVMQTDLCASEGIAVPRFSEETLAKLRQQVPTAGTIIGNPLDAWPIFYGAISESRVLVDIIITIASDQNIDSLVYMFDQFRYFRRILKNEATNHLRKVTDLMLEGSSYCRDVLGKPVFMSVFIDPFLEDEEDRRNNLLLKQAFSKANFPVYPSSEVTIKALAGLYRHSVRAIQEQEVIRVPVSGALVA